MITNMGTVSTTTPALGSKLESKVSLKTLDVPLSQAMYRHIESNKYLEAYQLATLGVTEQDWRVLGMQVRIYRLEYLRTYVDA